MGFQADPGAGKGHWWTTDKTVKGIMYQGDHADCVYVKVLTSGEAAEGHMGILCTYYFWKLFKV